MAIKIVSAQNTSNLGVANLQDLNRQPTRTYTSLEETETSERSKVARGMDLFAVLPLIGSVFGLARIIGSAAVAIYYKWHEKNISNSADMILRAQDEVIRGLYELCPFGGLAIAFNQAFDMNELEKTVSPSATGSYYCKKDNKLYYSNTPLTGKDANMIISHIAAIRLSEDLHYPKSIKQKKANGDS
jgi:hypothetical protein